jgi:osmotically-inducible protein OsmY
VKAALKEETETSDIRVTVDANQGEVILRGIVLNSEERAQTEAVAAAVTGVTGVHNQLRLMATSRRFASAKQT